MLEADHVAGPLVRHLGGDAVGVGPPVVDDVDHPGVARRNRGDFLDRGHRGDRPPGGQIDRVGGVLGEGRQAARLRRIGRDEQRPYV